MDYLAGPFIYRQVCSARGRERGESNEVVKSTGWRDAVRAETSQGTRGVNRSCERQGEDGPPESSDGAQPPIGTLILDSGFQDRESKLVYNSPGKQIQHSHTRGEHKYERTQQMHLRGKGRREQNTQTQKEAKQ